MEGIVTKCDYHTRLAGSPRCTKCNKCIHMRVEGSYVCIECNKTLSHTHVRSVDSALCTLCGVCMHIRVEGSCICTECGEQLSHIRFTGEARCLRCFEPFNCQKCHKRPWETECIECGDKLCGSPKCASWGGVCRKACTKDEDD